MFSVLGVVVYTLAIFALGVAWGNDAISGVRPSKFVKETLALLEHLPFTVDRSNHSTTLTFAKTIVCRAADENYSGYTDILTAQDAPVCDLNSADKRLIHAFVRRKVREQTQEQLMQKLLESGE